MDYLEFLIKKKIDQALFRKGEPVLFSEFEREYVVMGPKSFDHTKKFWFNKLRRTYHLAVVEKPKATIEQTDVIAQATTLESPTIAQKTGFVPRFKSAAPAGENQTEDKVTIEKSVSEGSVVQKKAGFVPRFKPASPAGEQKAGDSKSIESPLPQEPPAPKKPGFVPRFKPPVQKPPG